MSHDEFAPFILKGELQAVPEKSATKLPPYERLTRAEHNLCVRIGRRASAAIVKCRDENPTRAIVPPSWMWCATVIASVHLQQPLDLEKFAGAPDLDFLGEYLTLEAHLQRPDIFWPPAASALLKFKAPTKTFLEKIWMPFQKAH